MTMLCNITYGPNRAHRISAGKTTCREPAFPKRNQEGAITIAGKIQIGKMLAKTDQKLSQLRNSIARNVVCATARKVAHSSEQKAKIRGPKEGDEASSLNQLKSDAILKEAAQQSRPPKGRHGDATRAESGRKEISWAMQRWKAKPTSRNSDHRFEKAPATSKNASRTKTPKLNLG